MCVCARVRARVRVCECVYTHTHTRRLRPHTAHSRPYLPVCVFPHLPTSPHISGFAGTLELSAETAAAAWCELGACVARVGIRKLVLYNSHGGNHALAEVVARRLRKRHGMLTVLAMNLGASMAPGSACANLFPEDEMRYGLHGGALETSLMLHLRPQLVSTSAAKDFASRAAEQPKDAALQLHAPGFATKTGWLSQDLNAHGVVGAAATLSSAEKGATLARECVESLRKLLVEVHAADVDELLSERPLFPPQGDAGGELR